MATATVYIHGGDVDCSELVRMCYAAVGVLPPDSYMWTGNELELLTSHGFAYRSLGDPRIGDVLWRQGHTEIYLGDGMQGGARHGDYAGGLDGRKGDQDGTEVTRSKYRASDWSVLLRYEGTRTVGGIPVAPAAALVADHIIDHNAHGYSQPNRIGDGTTEAVTITWDESEDTLLTYTFAKDQPIRVAPSTKARQVGTYKRGKTVLLDPKLFEVTFDGRFWGAYVGETSGQMRYVCIGDVHGRGKVGKG